MTWRRGFTVVELVVVMVVMAILLTLGVVNLSSSQTNARNVERSNDIDVIAKGLESRYLRGNSFVTPPVSYITKGTYPSVNELLHAEGNAVAGILPAPPVNGYIENLLPGTVLAGFLPPSVSSTATIKDAFIPICATASTSPCSAANTGAEDTAKINAATTANVYVYEPITADNKVCFNTACVRFNLYYLPENGTIQTKASKHQ